MKRLLAACLLGVMVLAAAPAYAATAVDPDDVAGRLDVALVRANRTPYGATRITITTHDGFRSKLLRRSSDSRLLILFDADGTGTYEYRGRVVKIGDRLVLDIRGSGSRFEPLPVRHPDAKTLRVIVPGGSPPAPLEAYRIRIKTISGDAIDRAPDTGWVRVPAA